MLCVICLITYLVGCLVVSSCLASFCLVSSCLILSVFVFVFRFSWLSWSWSWSWSRFWSWTLSWSWYWSYSWSWSWSWSWNMSWSWSWSCWSWSWSCWFSLTQPPGIYLLFGRLVFFLALCRSCHLFCSSNTNANTNKRSKYIYVINTHAIEKWRHFVVFIYILFDWVVFLSFIFSLIGLFVSDSKKVFVNSPH